jgi:hypothetical protein
MKSIVVSILVSKILSLNLFLIYINPTIKLTILPMINLLLLILLTCDLVLRMESRNTLHSGFI